MMIGFALSPGSATFVPVDVTQSGDGYAVSDDGLNITFTGTEGRFAGLSVTLSKVDLAVGPVAYGAPVLSGDGTPEVGEVLSITPVEMWFYDAGRGAPVIDYVTDGVNAVDGLMLPLGAGDAGRDVTVTERASYDGSSFATAVSNVIRVEGVSAPDPTVPQAFETEDFSLADNADGTIALAITALPGDGGAALTDVEYSTDGAGTWRALASFAGTGSYDLNLASDGTAFEAGDYDVSLRAVNTVGAGAGSAVLSVTVTLPAGGGLNVTEIAGQIDINTDDPDDITVTISGNPAYNGSYVIVRADLAAGPVNLLPAVIAYTDATETELTHVPGLWVTDEESLTVDLIWQSDGADILNANTPDLQITEADAGATLTLLETATDTNGTRSQASNAIAIPVANTGGAALDVFEATFDTVIDPLSSSTDWESVSLSGDPALSDGTVARPGDAGASERLLATLSLPQAQFTEWRFGEIGTSPSAQYRHVLRSNRGGLYLFFRHISNLLSDFRIQTVGGANYRIGSTLNHPLQVGALYRAEITEAGDVTLTEDGVEIFAATLGAGDNAVIADAAGMDFRPSGQVQHHTISYFRAGALS